MDYDYYRDIKGFASGIFGSILSIYIFYKYRLQYPTIPREYKYSNIVIGIGCVAGSIHYYLSMHHITGLLGVNTVHYYDIVLFALVVGIGLAISGSHKYKPIIENEKRSKALKQGMYFYIILCVVLIAVRIAGEK